MALEHVSEKGNFFFQRHKERTLNSNNKKFISIFCWLFLPQHKTGYFIRLWYLVLLLLQLVIYNRGMFIQCTRAKCIERKAKKRYFAIHFSFFFSFVLAISNQEELIMASNRSNKSTNELNTYINIVVAMCVRAVCVCEWALVHEGYLTEALCRTCVICKSTIPLLSFLQPLQLWQLIKFNCAFIWTIQTAHLTELMWTVECISRSISFSASQYNCAFFIFFLCCVLCCLSSLRSHALSIPTWSGWIM